MTTKRLIVIAGTITAVITLVIVVIAAGILLYAVHSASVDSNAHPLVRGAPGGTTVDLEGLAVLGNAQSPIVLIEFSDYECPFCARHASTVYKELRERYVAAGKMQYAFANNPLPVHPDAMLLATAAICAGEQNAYWQMHDALFQTMPRQKSEVLELVPQLHLDVARFENCLGYDSLPTLQIAKEVKKAEELQLRVTPGFAIGYYVHPGQVKIIKLIEGAQPLTVFEKVIGEVTSARHAASKS